MVTHWDEISIVRPLIAAAIGVLQQQGHSKMEAYTMIARRIGKSDKWVRNIIGRNHRTRISFSDWLNIQALCARMNTLTERLDAQSEALARGDVRAAILQHLPHDPLAPSGHGKMDLSADASEGGVK